MPSSISAAHPSSSTTNTHSAYLANCRLVSTRSHLSKCIRRGLDHLQSKCVASALFLSSAMQTRHLIRPPPTTTANINIAVMEKESLKCFLKCQEKPISNWEICSILIHCKVSGSGSALCSATGTETSFQLQFVCCSPLFHLMFPLTEMF